MRNFLIRILQALVILAGVYVASSFAHADNFMYFKKKAAAGAGGGCSVTATYAQDNTDSNTDWLSFRWVGEAYTGATTYSNVCRIDFNVYSITGNISSKTYFLRTYTITSLTSDLGAQLTSTSIDGSAISTGWNTVTLPSPITIGPNTAIVIGETTPDYNNYFNISYSAHDDDANRTFNRWDAPAGVYSAQANLELAIKVYLVE